MARYFFHLYECGTVTRDEHGVERETLTAVHVEALEAARAVMCAEMTDGQLCLSCRIEVEDETGALVHMLTFKDAVTISGI